MTAPKFFGIDMQTEIANAFPRESLPNYVLKKNPAALRDPANQAGGVNSKLLTNIPIHGVIVQFDINDKDVPQQVQKDDVCLVIIAKPLADLGVEIVLSDFIYCNGKLRSVVWAKKDGLEAHWRVYLR